ncbi:hypothetical protein ACJRO7_032818 [Eucalyptus globulus]|uniref:Uncharacterized protein n=1 Tax=Eucalyptus globulus TaxID=34317 RepID=A0ABD3JKV1_EUCGL
MASAAAASAVSSFSATSRYGSHLTLCAPGTLDLRAPSSTLKPLSIRALFAPSPSPALTPDDLKKVAADNVYFGAALCSPSHHRTCSRAFLLMF